MARFVLMNKSQSNKASPQITYAIIMFRAENIDCRVDRKARSQMFAQSRKVSSIKPLVSSFTRRELFVFFAEKVVFKAKNTFLEVMGSQTPSFPYSGTICQKNPFKKGHQKIPRKKGCQAINPLKKGHF